MCIIGNIENIDTLDKTSMSKISWSNLKSNTFMQITKEGI